MCKPMPILPRGVAPGPMIPCGKAVGPMSGQATLLDDRVLGSTQLGFDRLCRIPKDRRREIEVDLRYRWRASESDETGRSCAETPGHLSSPRGTA